MIKVTQLVRQCLAQFQTNDEKGELVTDEIRVRYFVKTAKEAREYREALIIKIQAAKKDPTSADSFVYTADELAGIIQSLPDLGDAKGKPFSVPPTVEELSSLATINLDAIKKAIEEDLVPNEPPTK